MRIRDEKLGVLTTSFSIKRSFLKSVLQCNTKHNNLLRSHKRQQKMQWTREGAHNVLQIRALMASYKWEEKWLAYVMPNLDKRA